MSGAALKGEAYSLVIAAQVLAVVLIVSYMCLQLYKLYGRTTPALPVSPTTGKSGFLGSFRYAPSCRTGPAGDRRFCRGLTSGAMPSIDLYEFPEDETCGGLLGVPPQRLS